jgi:hypothetical protein
MADIIRIDFADSQDTLQGLNQNIFEFTSWGDDASIVLAAGRTEDIGGAQYRVEQGDLTITDSGVANGTVYVLVIEDGDGTASAYVSTKSGTYDGDKSGFYVNDASADNGAKVLFQMEKSAGPIYSRKARRWPNFPGGELENARLGYRDIDERINVWSLIF